MSRVNYALGRYVRPVFINNNNKKKSLVSKPHVGLVKRKFCGNNDFFIF